MVMPSAGLTPAWTYFLNNAHLRGQRACTLSRALHVVSTIICWCCHASELGGDCGARQDVSLARQALQPAHDPYGHIGTLPRSNGIAVAERVFLVL
jgi:hypothetical protein